MPLSDESKREIADLVACGRLIYRWMAGGVFVLSWFAGFLYLRHVELTHLSHTTVWTAWTILCACQALNVWAGVWTCLLQGVGYVGWDALIASFVNATTLTAQIITVLCGGRLVALASIAAAGALLQRALIRWFARLRQPALFSLRGKWNAETLRGMPNLAFRAWLTAVGTMLVFNTDQFFIASTEGAEGIPAYRAAYLVVLNLNMLAITFASSSAVFVSHLWQAHELKTLHHIVQRNVRLGLLIMFCGGACVLGLGGSLFDVWLGPNRFVGYSTLLVFFATLALETHSFIVVTSSRATEDEPFAASTLTAGILKMLGSWILMQRFGLLGIALGTLVAELFTNSWYMVFRGLRRLRLSLRDHLRHVLLPCLAVFIGALVLNFALLQLLPELPATAKVAASLAAMGVVFLAACWWLVLAPSERDRLRSFAGTAPSVRISKA